MKKYYFLLISFIVLLSIGLGGYASASDPIPSCSTVICRTNLIYGSEFGAWPTAVSQAMNSTVNTRVVDAGVKVIRFASLDCFEGTTCGRSGTHAGTEVRSTFDSAIQQIRDDGAILWIKMLPITKETLTGMNGNTVNGTIFCPSKTGNFQENLTTYEDVLNEIKVAGYPLDRPLIIETNNEMDSDCWSYWNLTGNYDSMVPTLIGKHYAANGPLLATYAKNSLGFSDVVVGAYIGQAGGTNRSGNSCTTAVNPPYNYTCTYNHTVAANFNQAVHDAGSPPPDFEAIHTYGHSTDFCASSPYNCVPDNEIFQYFRGWIGDARAQADNVWGSTLGDGIRFAISEGQAGVDNSGGTWNGYSGVPTGEPDSYYTGWINMLRGNGLMSGTGTRYWAFNLFCIACNTDGATGGNYNWIPTGSHTLPTWYATIKSCYTGGTC